MTKLQQAAWWEVRRAQNRKPATYVCPLCGQYLPALSEHMLVVPEGDAGRRRHAHTKCVLAARREGRLPTRREWEQTQPRLQSAWRRAVARLKRAGPERASEKPAGRKAGRRRASEKPAGRKAGRRRTSQDDGPHGGE